jgi:hypothetical protein
MTALRLSLNVRSWLVTRLSINGLMGARLVVIAAGEDFSFLTKKPGLFQLK